MTVKADSPKKKRQPTKRDIDWLGVCTAKPLWVRVFYRMGDTKNSMLGTNKSGHLGDPVSYKLATLIDCSFYFAVLLDSRFFFWVIPYIYTFLTPR
jgi:hypothetical protein